jgi:hypothetical protein
MDSSNPRSSDFSYKKYSLEQLDNWVNDAVNCEDLTPQDIYDTVLRCVEESVRYHKKYYTKSVELLSLLKGNREVDFGVGNDEPWDHTDLGETLAEATKEDWVDFWEENYYPEEYKQYTEEEMNAMCEHAATENDKEKCREYNLREAEYYNKRAELDAKVQAESSYDDGWTEKHYEAIVEEFSRNDPTRLKYEEGWVYESPDGGKTVTKRKPGSTEKIVVQKEEKKSWTLPVEESTINGVKDYYVTFPDDLLKAADLKEGDTVEWIDNKDGSFSLKKHDET